MGLSRRSCRYRLHARGRQLFRLDFGGTLGANDLGERFYANDSGRATSAPSTDIPEVFLPGSLSTLFVTLNYVDDVFNADYFGLRIDVYGALGRSVAPRYPNCEFLLLATALLGLIAVRRARRPRRSWQQPGPPSPR